MSINLMLRLIVLLISELCVFALWNLIFFEKILKNILLYQKKITTLGIENKHYLFILIKHFNFV